MESINWLNRTELLFGADRIEALKYKHVLVVGLGGVGAYAAEMICRAGVGRMTIADGDSVNLTNLNRQLVALHSTIGKQKAEIMKQRLLDINPELQLEIVPTYLKDESMVDLLKSHPYDYVVDAIDTLSPKIFLIYHSVNLGLKIVSSMGSGGRIDPTQVHIADIAQSYMCPLADVLRKRLHKLNIYTGVKVVFTPELLFEGSVQETHGEQNKKSIVGTVSYMPPLFGCMISSVVIRDLLGFEVKSDLPIPKAIAKKINDSLNI